MVADSPTTNLRLRRQGAGNNNNTWGDLADTTYDLIDDAITGLTTITVTADYTLSTANYVSDEARRAFIKVNGSPAANFQVICPALPKHYWFWNNTAKILTVASQGGGATVQIDAGDKIPVWCDGVGIHSIYFGGYNLKTYIASMTATAGAVPGVTGNAGKFLYTDGASAFWRQPLTTDLGDYLAKVLGVQVALAVAL